MEGAIDLIYLNRYIYYTFLFNAKKVGVCPPIATLQEKKHPTQIKRFFWVGKLKKTNFKINFQQKSLLRSL